MLETLSVPTSQPVEFVSLTAEVREVVAKSGVESGLCVIYVPHTTVGVTINENTDPDVVRDMVMELNKIVPFDDGYRHDEGNSAAHIKASMMGSSQYIPIEDGRLVLGIWQGIYFCEFDGPRSRRVHVKVSEATSGRAAEQTLRFTFEHMSLLGDADLRKVLAYFSTHSISVSLRCVQRQLQQRFLTCLPDDRAAEVKVAVSQMHPIPLRCVEGAQRQIVMRALALEIEGEIQITFEGDVLI